MQKLAAGARIAGFEVISARELAELQVRAVRCRHIATGLDLFHLRNDDPENLFAFTFRTPPPDSSGVAHILEHSVLCGSRAYPVKDPFVVLLKSSLQTFMNAFTFPDKTVYPAASMLEKDFFNLLAVYGDAVFFPLLREEVFLQEAHHLEPDPEQALKRVGVVYNEMKGVFSSSEAIVADLSFRSLFPDVPYAHESGGHPRQIPSLSYERFREYHRWHYHPSNCRLFLYGSIPTERILSFLQERLLHSFGPGEEAGAIPAQPRWSAPRLTEATYPVQNEGGDGSRGRSSVTMNWLTVPVSDPLGVLSMEVLSEILVGNVGSPLQKALLESGLGDDLSPATGLDTELAELVFSVGLRGTEPERAREMEALALASLEKLASAGIPEQLMRAAVHRVEFRNREILRGGRPFSLSLMRRSLRGWLHGLEPELTLEFRPWMDALKARLAEGGYLEQLIRRQLLSNPHRSTVLVRPDQNQAAREREEERREMQDLDRTLDAAGRERIAENLRRLQEFQSSADRSEELAKIPALHRRDLPAEVELIPTSLLFEDLHKPSLYHDLYTNGIVYADLVLDVSGLPGEAGELLPLFARCLCGCGLPGIPYHEVAGSLSLLTGGFGATLGADTPVFQDPGREARQYLIFRLKALEENFQGALELVAGLLKGADFRDFRRLEMLALELRNDLKSSLVPGGSLFAALRAGSRLAESLRLEERWKGVTQLLSMEEVCGDLRGRPERTAEALERLRGALIARKRLMLNLTCDRSFAPRARTVMEGFLDSLPESGGPAAPAPDGAAISAPASRLEALATSTNVSFTAVAVPASGFGTAENVQETVLAHYLATGFLWEEVRVKGGAYGAGASAGGLERIFSLTSYRDPNIARTLECFRRALIAARDRPPAEQEFEQALIGAVGREEKPMAPGEKGFVALKRALLGITDPLRQSRRERLLAATREDVSAAASRLLDSYDRGFAVVISGRPSLEGLGVPVIDIPD